MKFFPKSHYLTLFTKSWCTDFVQRMFPQRLLFLAEYWMQSFKFLPLCPLFCHYYKLYYVTLLISWVSGWMHGMVANTAIGKEGRLLSLPLSRCWKLSYSKRFLIQSFFTPLKYSNVELKERSMSCTKKNFGQKKASKLG